MHVWSILSLSNLIKTEFRAFYLQPYNYIVNCFKARNQEFLHENQFDLVLIKLHQPVFTLPTQVTRIGYEDHNFY